MDARPGAGRRARAARLLVDKYGFRDELKKIAPTYRDNQMTVNGKIYGFPDDGDVFVLYYRKDIFARADLQKAFKEKYKYDLAPPKTWKQFDDIGTFLTEKLKGEGIYGASLLPRAALHHVHVPGALPQRRRQVLRRQHMKATVNSPVGVKVLTEMRNENRFMPPGVEKFGFVENLAVFLKGESAMTISWPPYGRFAAGYLADEKALDWVPKSQIAGKVGYALPPGGHPELARALRSRSPPPARTRKPPYLFIQWLNSEEICNQRVQLPYALRDPFRDSHFTNKDYLAMWPDAKDYLAALKAGCEDRPARPVADPDRQVRRGAAPGHQQAVGRRRPEEDPRRGGRHWDPSPSRWAWTSRRVYGAGPPSRAPTRSKPVYERCGKGESGRCQRSM